MAERAARRAPLSSATQRQARPARPPVPRWDPAGRLHIGSRSRFFAKFPNQKRLALGLFPHTGRPRPSRLLGRVASRAPEKIQKPNSGKGKSDIALANTGQAKKP